MSQSCLLYTSYREREFEKIGTEHPEGALIHAVLGDYDGRVFSFDLATYLIDQPDTPPIRIVRHMEEYYNTGVYSSIEQYYHEHLKLPEDILCILLIYATKIGSVDILRFLMDHGLTSDIINNLSREQMGRSIDMAARILTDTFLDYLSPEMGFVEATTDLVFAIAMSTGNQKNVLSFLKKELGLVITDRAHVDDMIYSGNVDIVKYLHRNFDLKVESLDVDRVMLNTESGSFILEYLYSSGLVKCWYDIESTSDEDRVTDLVLSPLDESLCDPCPICSEHFLLSKEDGAIEPIVLYNTSCRHLSHSKCLQALFKHTNMPKCAVCSTMITSEPAKIIIPEGCTKEEAISILRSSKSYLLGVGQLSHPLTPP